MLKIRKNRQHAQDFTGCYHDVENALATKSTVQIQCKQSTEPSTNLRPILLLMLCLVALRTYHLQTQLTIVNALGFNAREYAPRWIIS